MFVLWLALALVVAWLFLSTMNKSHHTAMTQDTYRQMYDGGMGYSGGHQRDPFGSAGSATQPTMPFINYVDDNLVGW